MELPDDSDLLWVFLPVGNRSHADTEAILNAIVEAYRVEIVSKERLELVESLAKVRKRYQNIYDEIVKTRDQIDALSELLGVSWEGSTPNSKIELDVTRDHLLFLKKQLADLQLKKIRLIDESKKTLDWKSQLRSLGKQIEFIEKEIDSGRKTLDNNTNGELEARKAVLAALQNDLQTVSQIKTELEMKLEGSERVTIIQKAHCASRELE